MKEWFGVLFPVIDGIKKRMTVSKTPNTKSHTRHLGGGGGGVRVGSRGGPGLAEFVQWRCRPLPSRA